jgi:hypothetical protein
MVADDGGGRRQRMTMAREIGRRTTTGKVGSGWQTTMALSIRDGEEDVVFESSMATDKLGDDEYVRYY